MSEEQAKPEGPTTIAEQLYARLRRDVIMGSLEPGARLKLEKLSKSY